MHKRGAILVESRTGRERRLSKLFRAFQWKYNLDPSKPLWARLYFRWVFLPFNRFSYLHCHVVPFSRMEPDGSLSWKEDEGYFSDEYRAAQEAAKYPFGGYNEVAVDFSEGGKSCEPRVQFPNSTAAQAYVKRGKRRVELDLAPVERLQQVVEDAQRVVNTFRQQHQHSRPR